MIQRAFISKACRSNSYEIFHCGWYLCMPGPIGCAMKLVACSISRALYLNRLPKEAVDASSGNAEGQLDEILSILV